MRLGLPAAGSLPPLRGYVTAPDLTPEQLREARGYVDRLSHAVMVLEREHRGYYVARSAALKAQDAHMVSSLVDALETIGYSLTEWKRT